MKKLLVLFALGCASQLLAVNPVPYTEAVTFNLRMQGNGSASMTVYEESGSPSTWTFVTGGTSDAWASTAWMRPGKKYVMNVTGSGSGYYCWLSFIVPEGYTLLVDHQPRDLVALGWQTALDVDYTLELRPRANGSAAAPLGKFSGISLGRSVSWEIGLGALHGGRNAGRIIFKEYDLTNSPSSRERLYLGLMNSTNEVWSINDGPSNQTLRQVIAPLAVIDLLDDGSGGYWIRFFPHSQAEGSPGNPCILYGSPWKTIHVQSPAAGQLKITETEGNVSRVSQLTLTSGSVSSGNYVWTLQEGDGSTWLRTTTHTSTTGGGGTVASGGTVTTFGNYTLHTFSSNDTFTLYQPARITYLLVGGGGGGGGGASVNGGGGGGGGGFVTGAMAFTTGAYSVTVGQGGAAGTTSAGGDGGSSTINNISASGGGGGGGYGQGGRPGGCGGGAGRDTSSGGGSGSQGGSGGNAGGTFWGSAGGGGGAGTAGQPGGTDSSAWSPYYGNGGNAALSTIYGDNRYYAGGGGGAWQTSGGGVPQPGSYGGAGSNSGGTGGDGTDGRGGGGGGGQFANGGRGGSGVVVLRYANVRDVIEIVRTGGTGGTIVAKTKYRYQNIGDWGEELIQVVADPDTAALTTAYAYYTDSGYLGNYRKVRSVTGPTGNWTGYEYYNDWDRRGQLKYEFHPHLDSPATVPSTFDPTSGRVFYFEYTADWTGRHTRPTLRQEKINNVQTAKTTFSHGDTSTSYGPLEYFYTYSYRNASNYQTDYVQRFRADAWPTYAFRDYARKNADLTQVSWIYAPGNYNPATGEFYEVNESYAYVRYIFLHGSTSSSGADAVSSWDGQDFATVYLVPNKSTMDTVIYTASGLAVRTETWVYTGSGNFSLMTFENFTYDRQGRLTQRVANNGATVTHTYTDGRLTSTVGLDGTETQFTYDLIGRVATTVKKGAAASGNYAAQGDITTTYTYDGAGRVTQTVTSGGSLSLTTSAVYDLAGRLTSSTAPGSYTTSHAYSSGGKVVTTTLPGGATRISEVYLDGQTKSLTGTAVVAEYYTHNLQSDGTRELVHRQVSTSGPIVEYVYSDWLERRRRRQVPSPSGSGYTDQQWLFGSTGQLYQYNQIGKAATLYIYDTLGRLIREGLDVNANGTLDPASSDRLTDYGWSFFNSSGWWRRETTSTYATADSGTATQIGKVEVQLSGLSANRLSRSDRHDIYGNVTVTTVDVDRTNKKLTTTTDTPDSSINAVQVAYNGLLVEATDTAGITLRYGHDALGRQTTSADPRTGTTTIAYVSGTSQVYTVTDPASVVQATYTYDAAGRVSSVKNALNKYTYYAYTNRNEKYREWGDVAYPVEYGYDGQGRQVTMKTYRGGTGWTASTWPGNPGTADTTTWAYHAPTGLLTSKTDANNKSVAYTYTQAGQIDVRTWARGVTTDYGYSSTTGELLTVDYSDSTPDLTYTYNRLGKIATVADGSGTRTFNYNLAGTLELQSEDLPSYFGSRRITYPVATSGVIGRPTGLQLGTSGNPTADQSVSYGYATDGRLNSVAGGGQTFNYTYTANSHLVATVVNSGVGYTDTRTYDPYHDWHDNRTTTIDATTQAAFAYAQDNFGRVTQVDRTGELFARYGNGTQGLATVYGYDDRSQLTSEQTKLGGTSTVLTGRDDAYAYDNIGNRASSAGTTHNGNSAGYTTNALNQYTQRTVPGIFDVAGAAASGATVTVNGSSSGVTRHGEYFFKGHALSNNPDPVYTTLAVSDGTASVDVPAFLAGTPESFTYDDDGNLTSDGRWNYTYDAENRLCTVETTAAAVSAGVVRQLVNSQYDYLGRRIDQYMLHGWNGTAYTLCAFWRRFVYNGWNLMATVRPASGIIQQNVYWGLDLSGTMQGAGGVGGLLMVQEDGNSYLPIYDAMGNVHGMIKASDGTLAAAYEYDAFGNTLRESGDYAASNPFRFSTKYTDIETGLIYYGLRYYSPTLGRFVNRDPIEEQGGLNLYGFVGNNPVNRWDYLGMGIWDNIMNVLFGADYVAPWAGGEMGSQSTASGNLGSQGMGSRPGNGMDPGTALQLDKFVVNGTRDIGFETINSYNLQNTIAAVNNSLTTVTFNIPGAVDIGTLLPPSESTPKNPAPNRGAGTTTSNPTSTNPTTGTTVELRSNKISWLKWLGSLAPTHSYVVVTANANGAQWIYRAGPQGALWLDKNGTMGSFFGNIRATTDIFDSSHRDWNPDPASNIRVWQTGADPSQVLQLLDNFVSQVNSAGIPYSPFGTNSNSFAHQAVVSLGQPNPTPQTWEPSWNVPLPVSVSPGG